MNSVSGTSATRTRTERGWSSDSLTVDLVQPASRSLESSSIGTACRSQTCRSRCAVATVSFSVFSDWGWDGHRHLAEFDGKVKYLKYLRDGETPSACVFREKRREDAMRAEFFGMTRFVWEMVMPRSARRTMERLCYHLEQSRRLYVIGRAA